MAARSGGQRLLVDPLACDGIGLCAHVAASVVRLDSWGYPVMPATLADRRSRAAAQAAVKACPRRALFLTSEK